MGKGYVAQLCPFCKQWLNGPEQWDDHLLSLKHKRKLRHAGLRTDKGHITSLRPLPRIPEQTALYESKEDAEGETKRDNKNASDNAR